MTRCLLSLALYCTWCVTRCRRIRLSARLRKRQKIPKVLFGSRAYALLLQGCHPMIKCDARANAKPRFNGKHRLTNCLSINFCEDPCPARRRRLSSQDTNTCVFFLPAIAPRQATGRFIPVPCFTKSSAWQPVLYPSASSHAIFYAIQSFLVRQVSVSINQCKLPPTFDCEYPCSSTRSNANALAGGPCASFAPLHSSHGHAWCPEPQGCE